MADNDKLDLILGNLKNIDSRLNSIDSRLDSVNSRLEVVELKQELTHKKLDNLTLDIKVSERSIKKDIKLLQDAQETLITVLEHKGILQATQS